MYHAIVERKLRATLAGLSQGRGEVLTDQLADHFDYVYVGDHALGGVRRNLDDMAAWFARLYELFPDIGFEVRDVVVAGPPWRTTAMTHVRIVPDASGRHSNEMFQKVTIAWGRITSVHTLVDLDALRQNLERLASAGVLAATAPPINS